MGIIENAKELADLVKKVGDIDLYRRIIELEGEIIELTRAVRSKDDRIAELQAALKMVATLSFQPPFYFAEGDQTPYCANCWETRQLAVHTIYKGETVNGRQRYFCPNCTLEFHPERRFEVP